MRITHNKDKSTTRYQVSGTELRNVTSYKDLGVIMASDLTWTINMFIKQTRGNKGLDIRRTEPLRIKLSWVAPRVTILYKDNLRFHLAWIASKSRFASSGEE